MMEAAAHALQKENSQRQRPRFMADRSECSSSFGRIRLCFPATDNVCGFGAWRDCFPVSHHHPVLAFNNLCL